MTVTVSPAFASAPVPVMISLITSLLGGGPEGGVTVGSFDSGPLVGVGRGRGFAEPLRFASASCGPVLLARRRSELLEPLEPQPAMSATAASVARARTARERVRGKVFEVGHERGSLTELR